MWHHEVACFGSNLTGETCCARTDEEFVGQALEQLACDADGVKKALEGTHGAGSEGCAIHDRSIEFHLSQQIGPATSPDCADRLVRLDQPDASFNRIQSCPST
jgi:hypothetical protein